MVVNIATGVDFDKSQHQRRVSRAVSDIRCGIIIMFV